MSCDPLAELHRVLLDVSPKTFERLVRGLLSWLVGVPFRLAGGGEQGGGDVGVVGPAGRDLICEARRYGDTSRLDRRQIEGEIQQAIRRNPDLEAWILVTTQEVPEQVRTAMVQAGQRAGVAALIIDWLPQPLPGLAALCAFCPDCFEAVVDSGHRGVLADIEALPAYESTLEALRAELRGWAIGYQTLRDSSHTWLRDIWATKRLARSRFGQMVAGGADGVQHVRRSNLIARIEDWWASGDSEQPGVLLGREGMGKTWVALDWLQSSTERLPIVVTVPSSAVADRSIATRTDLVEFIAGRLIEHDTVASWPRSYWIQRVERVLARPVDEGAVFVLYLDGLNQVPTYQWIRALSQLLEEGFYGRVRLLLSARTTYVNEFVGRLNTVFGGVWRIEVPPYDLAPGGEFDDRLRVEGLSRGDLPEPLIPLASVPRLFDLVVTLRNELGDARDVTVHRLLWAYGARVIGESTGGAFDESGWRSFLRALADEYLKGNVRPSVERVAALAKDPRLTADKIHLRTSSVVESVFGVLDADGDVNFEPDFVHHALGLALAKRAGEAAADIEGALSQFLDPIEGLDERAEILCAAVTIAMQRPVPAADGVLGALCTAWVQTPNIAEHRADDLAVLAPGLVEPLLDAVERSAGQALHGSRYIALNALASVDNESLDLADAISVRATRWLRRISLEGPWGSDSGRHRERLQQRLGVRDLGKVTVAGHEIEIVKTADSDLHVAAAQLMQHRPLCGAGEYFEVGAAQDAVTGESQLEQSWLNVVNEIDAERTAMELRSRADALCALAHEPEPGIDPYVYRRMAALLLWWTGYAEDIERARAIDPWKNWQAVYEAHYLKDPGQSGFALERRHAAQVLRDGSLHVRHRIQRAKEALLDPGFQLPPGFADSVVSATQGYCFDETATGRSRTAEDLGWEELSLGLARCAPDVLASLERARLRSYAGREEDARYGAALVAPSLMLLARREECSAMEVLRRRVPANEDEGHEFFAKTYLLTFEIQCHPPAEQIRRILESGVDGVDRSLAIACSTPSMTDVDELVAYYHADGKRMDALAAILAPHETALSQTAFNCFQPLLKDGDERFNVWVLLASRARRQLGEVLNREGWAWSACKSRIENVAGSLAVAEASRGTPFTEYAHRIAPARLLRVLSQGGHQKEDVELAVELLRAVLCQVDVDPPQPDVEVTHNREQGGAMENYLCSVGDVREPGARDSLSRFMKRTREDYLERRNELAKRYVAEVEEVRRSGAHLHLADIVAEDFDAVLDHCPEAIESWLEGMDSSSKDFVRRVQLADGFFVALCEALLNRGHPLAVRLWHALRACLKHVSFRVYGDMDRLVHALFAAPPSAEVDQALEGLLTLEGARTDRDLIDLIVAARRGGRTDWLTGMIERDAVAPCPANRQRFSFLKPLVSRPQLGQDWQWPQGGRASIEEAAWMLGQREAFAAEWLRRFAQADTAEEAHAAWQLFVASADSRVWSWLHDELDSQLDSKKSLDHVKRRMVVVDRQNLERAIKANVKSWSETYAKARYPKALQPWCWR